MELKISVSEAVDLIPD